MRPREKARAVLRGRELAQHAWHTGLQLQQWKKKKKKVGIENTLGWALTTPRATAGSSSSHRWLRLSGEPMQATSRPLGKYAVIFSDITYYIETPYLCCWFAFTLPRTRLNLLLFISKKSLVSIPTLFCKVRLKECRLLKWLTRKSPKPMDRKDSIKHREKRRQNNRLALSEIPQRYTNWS